MEICISGFISRVCGGFSQPTEMSVAGGMKYTLVRLSQPVYLYICVTD